MPVSGAVATKTYEVMDVVSAAVARCRFPQAQITPQILENGIRNLNLALTSLKGAGCQLWKTEKILLSWVPGNAAIRLPAGTEEVNTALYRSQTLVAAAAVTTPGLGGNIRLDFGAAGANVSTLGYALSVPVSEDAVVESSADGVTWATTELEAPLLRLTPVRSWVDVAPINVRYVRFRVGAATNINVVSSFVAAQRVAAVEMARIAEDDYTSIPNRWQTGRPVQYWLDKQRDNFVLRVWPAPAPEYVNDCIEVWRQRQIMDVLTLAETVDVPQRWYESLVFALAVRMSLELPGVDPNSVMLLKAFAREELELIQAQERDPTPIRLQPNYSRYMRA